MYCLEPAVLNLITSITWNCPVIQGNPTHASSFWQTSWLSVLSSVSSLPAGEVSCGLVMKMSSLTPAQGQGPLKAQRWGVWGGCCLHLSTSMRNYESAKGLSSSDKSIRQQSEGALRAQLPRQELHPWPKGKGVLGKGVDRRWGVDLDSGPAEERSCQV